MIKVRYRGERCCVVLSSLARYGVIVAWLGTARSCPDWRGNVWHGLIEALQGLASYGTVLSCPARFCKARRGVSSYGVELWGGVLSCWVKSCLVLQGSVRRFMARSCGLAWGTVERGFVLLGKVSFWQGGVVQSEVRYAEPLLRYGLAKCGTVVSGFALLRAVGQGLLSLSHGVEKQGSVMRGAARCCKLQFGKVLLWPGSVMSGGASWREVIRVVVLSCKVW